MIITRDRTIQDFALFEGDTGALKPLKFTRAEGGEFVDWANFKAGDNVQTIVLDDNLTTWNDRDGITVVGPALEVFLAGPVNEEPVVEAVEPVEETPVAESTPAEVEAITVEAPKKKASPRKKKTV
ncbi:hypothetical protein [Rhizobium sp. L43]|uniref:hypothetical protein n=1 Tax=Rhizobium sp. L43 TaxID=2035452 RepID=UPI000BE814F8|nr:hypothetical protein [Rhizobium sp. L43]PDS75457.1 hypothetical protein CO667_26610 [Rhizobium sp. L43]